MKKLRKIIGPVTAAVAMVSLLFNFTACNTGSPLSSTYYFEKDVLSKATSYWQKNLGMAKR